MENEDRGTGRTTKQMKEAKNKSVFVWCNEDLNYPKQLAKDLNKDLEIVGPSWFEKEHRFVGRNLTGIVLDHATNLNIIQSYGYNKAILYIR
jgi:hypothetical protein